jgi:hypothetical protein
VLAVSCSLALVLSVWVPEAFGRPLASPRIDQVRGIPASSAPRPGRVISDAGLRLPLPHRWHGVVVYGGIGSNPSAVGELVVANFRLPRTAAECEGLMPKLSRHEVLLRIYDYGRGTFAGAWRAGPLHLGRLRPVHDWAMRSRAIAVARIRFHSRFLVVQGVFGARSPAAMILRRVGWLLDGALAA